MESIHLKLKTDTPEVIFDSQKQIFSIKGKSLPENASMFYKPLYDWIIDYFNSNKDKGLKLDVDLEYLNSSSIKLVFLIFGKINEYYQSTTAKSETLINWHYNKNDDLTKVKGLEFKELLDMPFNVIPKD